MGGRGLPLPTFRKDAFLAPKELPRIRNREVGVEIAKIIVVVFLLLKQPHYGHTCKDFKSISFVSCLI